MYDLKKVQVSVTDMCNRKCSFCPHVDNLIFPNKKVWMSVDTAQRLATDLSENNFDGIVSISGYGEPLLHPKIFDIVKEFTSRNIKTRMMTNGDLLVKKKVSVEELDSLGLFEIKINIYDDYNQFVKYGGFFYKRIKKTPFRLAKNFDSMSGQQAFGINYTNRAGTLKETKTDFDPVCYEPTRHIMIDWNGDVLICCNDWIRKEVYGNLNESSFYEIWNNSEKLNDHRKLLLEGKRCDIITCQNCDFNSRR